MSISLGTQLEKSYRGWVHGSGFREAEINVVLNGTAVILRRHSIQGSLCSECGNDDPNQCVVASVDKLGFITAVECVVCGKRLSTICRTSKYYLERIKYPAVLERGDHFGWYRPLGYWHHAIVTQQSDDRIAVVGYTIKNRDTPCAKVTEDVYRHRSLATLKRGSVYRITHDDSYNNEYTALRAERTIGEEKYDFFEQNCEQSTMWCKTGLHSSAQLESGFMSFGRIALSVFLRCAVLAVLWLLQICSLAQDSATTQEGMWLEQGVNIAYLSLIVIVFSAYSINKDCSKVKLCVEPPVHELQDDCMESCRKSCTNGFFACCCRNEPSCSRLTCSVCFVACFCCSFCEGSCSLCAEKLRMCRKPCCGRPIAAVVGLVLRIVVRELIAASAAFLVVRYMRDIVAYFEARNVFVSANLIVNRAFIVIVALLVVSLVVYPIAVVISRWVQGLIECCWCPCDRPSKRALYKHDECVDQPCPVHDEILHIPVPYEDYHMTNIDIDQSDNPRSAVILL